MKVKTCIALGCLLMSVGAGMLDGLAGFFCCSGICLVLGGLGAVAMNDEDKNRSVF